MNFHQTSGLTLKKRTEKATKMTSLMKYDLVFKGNWIDYVVSLLLFVGLRRKRFRAFSMFWPGEKWDETNEGGNGEFFFLPFPPRPPSFLSRFTFHVARSKAKQSKAKAKQKAKQPYLTSITRNSNSTDKPEVDGALILLPPLHQCSFLQVFKAT